MEKKLELIDPFKYVAEIKAKWAWRESHFHEHWYKIPVAGSSKLHWGLYVGMGTGGLSDHERIIKNMDKTFWSVCWELSRRGGFYKFIINPEQWGYKLVNDYAREKGVSRQSIYNYPDKFEWLHVSKGVKFIKPFNPLTM